MDQMPDWLLEIASECDLASPTDINKAVDSCLGRISQDPRLLDLTTLLLRTAVRELIHRSRHQRNVQLKREALEYGGAAKVNHTDARAVERAWTFYDFCIGGRILGDLRGEELPDLIQNEEGQIRGHACNRDFLIWLQGKVPADKTVRQTLTDKQLKAQWQRVARKYEAKPEKATG